MSMSASAAAEWMKLRSLRSTWWFLGGALVAMLLVGPSTAMTMANNMEGRGEPLHSVEAASVAVVAVAYAVQFVLGALGMLAMTGEFATGSIATTLACTPSRARTLLSKAGITGLLVFAAGVPIAAIGVGVSLPLLEDYADFDGAQVAGQVLAMGVYLALIAVLAVGLGTLIRRSAGTIAVLFGLLMVAPMVLLTLGEALGAKVFVRIADFTPTIGGERFMDGELLYGLVPAVWAAVALFAGIRALRARDA